MCLVLQLLTCTSDKMAGQPGECNGQTAVVIRKMSGKDGIVNCDIFALRCDI